MLNKDLQPVSDLSVTLFNRVEGSRTEEILTEIPDVSEDAYEYLTDNNIKVSMDSNDDPDQGAFIYFDSGAGYEITVSTKDLPCVDVMEKGVELIKEQKAAALDYKVYLAKLVELSKKVKNPAISKSYPKSLDSSAKRALYDNLNSNAGLAVALHNEIMKTKKADFRGNLIKERQVKNAIRKHLEDEADIERIFELVLNQNEF